jgi:microsomal dipeptidase-like Zn-dependent dipeptidase
MGDARRRDERAGLLSSRLMWRRLLASLMLLVGLAATSARADAEELPDLSVDLHAHLFMEEGLGWLFRGRFDGPRRADSWDDRLSSKMDAASLEASGIGVVVVALFAHPVYVADMREAVRAQIRATKRFVHDHPMWAIAKSSAEARRLLAAGRRVLVFSLEGASGVLETERDLVEFVDVEGIRIVTELHLVDDRYGGVATLDGYQFLANPRGIVDGLLDAHHDHAGVSHNPHGLTSLGRRLAVELIRRGVWIDLTHASDPSLDELASLMEQAGHPLLLTHAQLRRHRPAERATSDATLARVAASGGVVGLLPSEDAFARVNASHCPPGCSPEACRKSVHAFATAFTQAAAIVGEQALMLGSDFNGGMRHLSAACRTGTALDDEAGMFHVGQTALLWQTVRALGAPVPPHRVTLEHFLDTWAAVVPYALPHDDLPELPTQDEATGPSIGLGLGLSLATGDTGGAAFLPRLTLKIRKDHGRDVPVEPMFQLLRADAELAKTLNDASVPYAQARVAPFGVELVDADNLLVAEALQLLWRRHEVLDQERRLRLAAFSGAAQSMIGLWKAPPMHDLFVAARLDLLGYEGIRHLSARPDLHGVFLLGGGAGFGASMAPTSGWVIRVRTDAEADLSLLVNATGDGIGYQTDVLVGGGLELGTGDRSFTQFVQMRWYATREKTLTTEDRDTPHVRAGLQLGF